MGFRVSGNLVVAGQRFTTDAPIASFHDTGWDATREQCIDATRCVDGRPSGDPAATLRRYGLRPALTRYARNPPLDAVKAIVDRIVIDQDGVADAETAFRVLHDELGQSVHFLVDNDGTIFQTLDLAFAARHVGDVDATAISIMLSNRGDADREPSFYATGRHGPRRDLRPVAINGVRYRAFEYTTEQYQALQRLLLALASLLLQIPLTYPRDTDGTLRTSALPPKQARTFRGVLGRYHLDPARTSPGPFDFANVVGHVAGRSSFPVAIADAPTPPELPVEATDPLWERYFTATESTGIGTFPVGPFGDQRLWHGGIHLPAQPGTPVVSPLSGVIVAARSSTGPIGSTSFVLVRHELSFGATPARFFTLLMHLAPTPSQTYRWQRDLARRPSGETQLLEYRVAAGEEVGRVGVVGPAELARGQIHVEMFSSVELVPDVPNAPWRVIDGSATGRFCDDPSLIAAIDRNSDRRFATDELAAFYRSSGVRDVRDIVPYHVSEWIAEPSWSESLALGSQMSRGDIDELVEAQITPGLWWTEEVALHARLPATGIVYHYHPIRLLAECQRLTRQVPPLAELDDQCAAKLEDLVLGDEAAPCEPAPPKPRPRPGLIDD